MACIVYRRNIDVHKCLPLLRRCICKKSNLRNAGIVYQIIDVTGFGKNGLNHIGNKFIIGNITNESMTNTAILIQ